MLMKANNKTKSTKKISSAPKWQIALLIPYLVFSVIFIILPIFLILYYGFKPLDGQKVSETWEIVGKASTWRIMFRSLWTGLIAAIISFMIGFPYAYILSRSKSVVKILGLSLILSPMVIFTISKALAVRGLFSAMFDENKLNNSAFMIFGMVYLYLPFMVMPLYQILKDMPNNIIEASQDLGYSKFKTVLKVIIPYCYKGILSGFSIILMMSSTSIIIADKMLPNGSQNQLIGNLINQFANTSNPFDLATSSTLVIVTMLILMALYGLIYGIPYIISKKRQGGVYE